MADAVYQCQNPGGILGPDGVLWPDRQFRVIDDSEEWVARWEAAGRVVRSSPRPVPARGVKARASGAHES